MAFSLVGTIGAARQGALSAAVTPAWGASENRTAGNLLVCFVAGTGSGVGAAPAAPSGWTRVGVGSTTTSPTCALYYKIAAGADTAPTIAAITNVILTAQLAEFSGNASSSPLDKNGG